MKKIQPLLIGIVGVIIIIITGIAMPNNSSQTASDVAQLFTNLHF